MAAFLFSFCLGGYKVGVSFFLRCSWYTTFSSHSMTRLSAVPREKKKQEKRVTEKEECYISVHTYIITIFPQSSNNSVN